MFDLTNSEVDELREALANAAATWCIDNKVGGKIIINCTIKVTKEAVMCGATITKDRMERTQANDEPS